jgi:predicted GNAT family N-acyltransferase
MGLIFRFVAHGSGEWLQARDIRYALFFQSHGLVPTIMDDDHEAVAFHLVALAADRVVGYGRLIALGEGEFQISQMVVPGAHQRQGIGTVILQNLMRKALDGGAQSIVLEARLPAVGFYERAGFVRCGVAYPSAKTGIPHVTMKFLPAI